jgi:antitoxin (DNA-binding transcriptional repressor) of toxin-antitoxin stability system
MHLSQYLRKVKEGESFAIWEDGKEIARLTPVEAYSKERLKAFAVEDAMTPVERRRVRKVLQA